MSSPPRSQTNTSNSDSLDAATDTLVDSCSRYLDENRVIDIPIKKDCKPPPSIHEQRETFVRIIPVVLADDYHSKPGPGGEIKTSINKFKNDNLTEIEKLGQRNNRNSLSYGTLPNALKKQQKHVRSLIVPKMRRMFEKSKSVEPERTVLTPSRTIRIKIQDESPQSPAHERRENDYLSKLRCDQDGTESVSSFVAVNKNLLDVVDNKRKKYTSERGKSASLSSIGDEWSPSEDLDQFSDNNVGATKPRCQNAEADRLSQQHQEFNQDKIPKDDFDPNDEIKSEISIDGGGLSNDASNEEDNNENDVNLISNKSFVNKCVSKVKSLVNSKQSSPQPGQ